MLKSKLNYYKSLKKTYSRIKKEYDSAKSLYQQNSLKNSMNEFQKEMDELKKEITHFIDKMKINPYINSVVNIDYEALMYHYGLSDEEPYSYDPSNINKALNKLIIEQYNSNNHSIKV